jgi:uncharacterized protein (DUF2236 family)
MTVARDELERSLGELRGECPDPRIGVHGPQSVSWRIDRESALFLAGGRAALLQLSHPYVAYALDQHSQTRRDPLGRFQRTFDSVYAMVFGDLERAIRAARHVHAVHARVYGEIAEDVGAYSAGQHYQANDEEALLWVHATLVDSALLAYDLIVKRLTEAEQEAYWHESKRSARLFGIPERVLPDCYGAFCRYVETMLASKAICVTRPALEMRRFLFRAPFLAERPLFRWLELMTAGLMPERLRGELELSFGSRERWLFTGSIAALRAGYPLLPRRLRFVPAYHAALRRLAGREGPDHIGRVVERLSLLAVGRRATPRVRTQ